MKIPLSWLKEFIAIELSPTEIGEKLTLLGLELENISFGPTSFEGVVVGKVLSVAPHPNAERLMLAKVSDGKEEFDIVCGAPNCRAGIKTAFAKVGALLKTKDGTSFTIKKTKIRGFTSNGMLCSHEELLLPEKDFGVKGGIMELPQNYKEGTDLRELFSDSVLSLALTPNLNYAASILGVAKELAASEDLIVKLPTISFVEEKSEIEKRVDVNVENAKFCPRYACRLITDVKVGPSPEWLTERLVACGIRPVNNVVDITNYVLLELGHPLHAFDFDTIEGGKLIVRPATSKDEIVTLDGKKRFPTTETLLICDAKKPLAIAGIMGGEVSEVKENTTRVLLEAAFFDPRNIRISSKRLALSTEASRRFERTTDPNALHRSLDRAAMLMATLAGGKVTKGIIDISKTTFPEKEIDCRINRANQILGVGLAISEIEAIFTRLGFKILSSYENHITVSVPTSRPDILHEIDLIEEIARHYGYNNIYQKKQVFYREGLLPNTSQYLFEKQIRQILLKLGLQELLTLDLISPKLAELIAFDCFPKRALIHILNPTSLDQSILRPTLLPGLLNALAWNVDHGISSLSGYEMGKIHFKTKDQFFEPTALSLILAGQRNPSHPLTKEEESDFFDLKGMIESLLAALHLEKAVFKHCTFSNFHPGRQAEIFLGEKQVGLLGQLHPDTLEKIGLHLPVYFAEMSVEDLFLAPKTRVQMKPLPHFPATTRDLTITIKDSCPIDKVLSWIDSIPSQYLEEFSLLDVYHSEKLGSLWKNVTLRFIYRDQEKTISFKIADQEHQRITDTLFKKLKRDELIKT